MKNINLSSSEGTFLIPTLGQSAYLSVNRGLEEALSLLPLVDSSLLRSGAGSPAEIGQLRQQCENLRVAVEHIRGLGHGDTLTAASSRFLDAIAAELDR